MPYMFKANYVENWAYLSKAFSPEECQKIIDLKNDYSEKIGTTGNDNNDFSIRKSKIYWIPYDNEKTKWLYDKLAKITDNLNHEFFKFHLDGFVEEFQLTKYESPDGFYNYHQDLVHKGTSRKLSIVVQLTDPNEYEGGELELLYDKNSVQTQKDQGNLVIFPSYVLHQVKPITKGIRHSLVVWVHGDPFK